MARASYIHVDLNRVSHEPEREYVSILSIPDREGREKWSVWNRNVWRQSLIPIDPLTIPNAQSFHRHVRSSLSSEELRLQKQHSLILETQVDIDSRKCRVRVTSNSDEYSYEYVVKKNFHTSFSQALAQFTMNRLMEEDQMMVEAEQQQHIHLTRQEIQQWRQQHIHLTRQEIQQWSKYDKTPF